MLDADGYVKITDFGLSKEEIAGNTGAFSFCGTPEYLAPEILAKKGHGKAVDWWSLGALVYEMLTGLPPFYTRDRERLFQNIQFGEINYPASMSPAVKDLLSGLFQKNPDNRLGSGSSGSQDIKRHPWFGPINWDQLFRKQASPPFVPNLGSNPIRYFDKTFTDKPAVDSVGREEAKLSSTNDFPGFSYENRAL